MGGGVGEELQRVDMGRTPGAADDRSQIGGVVGVGCRSPEAIVAGWRVSMIIGFGIRRKDSVYKAASPVGLAGS